ncbi:MAG: ABC transporter ATP-binding protein [Caulobacteraceae bacterium]
MAAPLAQLREAGVAYGGAPALGPLSLSIAAGEIVALTGPSGCGKSTALRLLAGLEAPSSGAVTRQLARGETGFVFQAPTLLPWASVLDNVALPLRLAGVASEAACERARETLALARLNGVERLKPAQLSGGMAMRAALARALVTRPRLLLLDEPFAALDELTRRALADDLHRIWAEQKPAMVFVTHNIEEAAYMAERVVVLSGKPGRAAAEIAVEAPLPRPPGVRTDPAFLRAVEAISSALVQREAA